MGAAADLAGGDVSVRLVDFNLRPHFSGAPGDQNVLQSGLDGEHIARAEEGVLRQVKDRNRAEFHFHRVAGHTALRGYFRHKHTGLGHFQCRGSEAVVENDVVGTGHNCVENDRLPLAQRQVRTEVHGGQGLLDHEDVVRESAAILGGADRIGSWQSGPVLVASSAVLPLVVGRAKGGQEQHAVASTERRGCWEFRIEWGDHFDEHLRIGLAIAQGHIDTVDARVDHVIGGADRAVLPRADRRGVPGVEDVRRAGAQHLVGSKVDGGQAAGRHRHGIRGRAAVQFGRHRVGARRADFVFRITGAGLPLEIGRKAGPSRHLRIQLHGLSRAEHDIRSQFQRVGVIVPDVHFILGNASLHIDEHLHEAAVQHRSTLGERPRAPRKDRSGVAGIEGHGLTGTHRLVGSEIGRVDLDADDVHRHVLLATFGRGHRGETTDLRGIPCVAFRAVGPRGGRVRPSQGQFHGFPRADLTTDRVEVDRFRSFDGADVRVGIARLSALVLGHPDGRSRIDGRAQGITRTDHVGIGLPPIVAEGQEQRIHAQLVAGGCRVEHGLIRILHRPDDVVPLIGENRAATEQEQVLIVSDGRPHGGVAEEDAVVEGDGAGIGSNGPSTARAVLGQGSSGRVAAFTGDGLVAAEGAMPEGVVPCAGEKGAAESGTTPASGRAVVGAVTTVAPEHDAVGAIAGVVAEPSGGESATATTATDVGRACILTAAADVAAVAAFSEVGEALATLTTAAAELAIAPIATTGDAIRERTIFKGGGRALPSAHRATGTESATTATAAILAVVAFGDTADEQAPFHGHDAPVVDAPSETDAGLAVPEHHAAEGQIVAVVFHGAARVIPVEAVAQLKIVERHDGAAPGQFEEAAVAVCIDDGGPGACPVHRDVALVKVQLAQDPVVVALGQRDVHGHPGHFGLLEGGAKGAQSGGGGTDPIPRIGIGTILDGIHRVLGHGGQNDEEAEGAQHPTKDDVNHGHGRRRKIRTRHPPERLL